MSHIVIQLHEHNPADYLLHIRMEKRSRCKVSVYPNTFNIILMTYLRWVLTTNVGNYYTHNTQKIILYKVRFNPFTIFNHQKTPETQKTTKTIISKFMTFCSFSMFGSI